MDVKKLGEKSLAALKKYKFAAIILAVGLILMLLPTGKTITEQIQPTAEKNAGFDDQTEQLINILSQIEGTGKVQILLTVAAGEQNVYQTDSQTDTNSSGESVRLETVIITDSERSQQALITQILAPEYRGAVVVCEGAADPAVKLAVMEAVKNATGLSFDRISVLKMK